jgi:hypothetical protein
MTPVRLLVSVTLIIILISLLAPPRGAAQGGPDTWPTPQPTSVGPPPGFRLQQVVPDWEGRYFSDYKRYTRDCAYYLDPLNGITPDASRFDNAIDFVWDSNDEPAPGVSKQNYLVCWDVSQSLTPGVYRFHIYTDDGMRVFINNQKIDPLDQWRDQPPTWYWSDVLVPGNALEYLFRVDYYNHLSAGFARFWWESLDDYPDWKGEYFRNETLSGGPVVTRNDPAIDFNWGVGSPALGLSYDHFSVRWSRKMEFAGGFYRFWVQSDDGARLYIDPAREFVYQSPDGTQRVEAGRYLNPILDRWYIRALTTDHVDTYLTPGTHTVVLEYFEYVGQASARMWWERW